jgi:hypothetical protein
MKLSELKEQIEFVQAQKEFSEEYFETAKSVTKELTADLFLALLADREQLREALQFYASHKSWHNSFDSENRVTMIDVMDSSKTDYPKNPNAKFGGKRARAALAKSDELEK